MELLIEGKQQYAALLACFFRLEILAPVSVPSFKKENQSTVYESWNSSSHYEINILTTESKELALLYHDGFEP